MRVWACVPFAVLSDRHPAQLSPVQVTAVNKKQEAEQKNQGSSFQYSRACK